MACADIASAGIVVIGRNEGDRLRRCLESVIRPAVKVVYVDSGSTDASVAMARQMGAEVVELDMSIPFCAARARNAGYQHLVAVDPAIRFVQFVDGDCELACDWLQYAVNFLEKNTRAAIVVGWLREKSPEMSVYNRIGDLEWNLAGVGELESVGGIFLIRRESFDSVNGFDPTISAGEEPELCQRLNRLGWKFFRLDRGMALHDLAMMHFGQWYRRHVRTGYAGLDVANRFGLERFKKITRRARLWSIVFMLTWAVCLIAGLIGGTHSGVAAVVLATGVWVVRWCRIAWASWRNGVSASLAAIYAGFTVISFWPQMSGQLMYWRDRANGRAARLLEHKGVVR